MDAQQTNLRAVSSTQHMANNDQSLEVAQIGVEIKQYLQLKLDNEANLKLNSTNSGYECGEGQICLSRLLASSITQGNDQFNAKHCPKGWVQALVQSAMYGYGHRYIKDLSWIPGNTKNVKVTAAQYSLKLVDRLLPIINSPDDAAFVQYCKAALHELQANNMYYEPFSPKDQACLVYIESALDAANASFDLYESQGGQAVAKSHEIYANGSTSVFDTALMKLIQLNMKKSDMLFDDQIIKHYPNDKVRSEVASAPMQKASALLKDLCVKYKDQLDSNGQIELELLQMDLDLKIQFLANSHKKDPLLSRKATKKLREQFDNISDQVELVQPPAVQFRLQAALVYLQAEIGERAPTNQFNYRLDGVLPRSSHFNPDKAQELAKSLVDRLDMTRQPIEQQYSELPREQRYLINRCEEVNESIKSIRELLTINQYIPKFLKLKPRMFSLVKDDYQHYFYEPQPFALEYCDFTPEPFETDFVRTPYEDAKQLHQFCD